MYVYVYMYVCMTVHAEIKIDTISGDGVLQADIGHVCVSDHRHLHRQSAAPRLRTPGIPGMPHTTTYIHSI